MFTGIIESMGKVVSRQDNNGNVVLAIQCPFAHELSVNQSIAHNGACLSVTDIKNDIYKVTMIRETVNKTCLGELLAGDFVNLERSMKVDSRFDGHIVQGHVDKIGICSSIHEEKGSKIFTFTYDQDESSLTVEKGSIAVNGISLTVINSSFGMFSVAVIPYTLHHTNMQFLKIGNKVNLEFDIIGKYISRIINLRIIN
jgi:riboflavin synthase